MKLGFKVALVVGIVMVVAWLLGVAFRLLSTASDLGVVVGGAMILMGIVGIVAVVQIIVKKLVINLSNTDKDGKTE